MSYQEQKRAYLNAYASESESESKARAEGYEAGYKQSTENWCKHTR